MKIVGAVFENHAFNHFEARNNRLGNTLLLIFYILRKLELIIYSREKSVWRYLSPISCNRATRKSNSKKNSTIDFVSNRTNQILLNQEFHFPKFQVFGYLLLFFFHSFWTLVKGFQVISNLLMAFFY